MSWFRFYSDVILQKGNVRSTLYFLGEEKTIQLSKIEGDVLQAFDENSIEDVKKLFGDAITTKALSILMKNGMGNIYENKVYSEPYQPHLDYTIESFFQPKLIIQNLYIQANNDKTYNKESMKCLSIHEGCNSFIAPCNEDIDYHSFFELIEKNMNELKKIKIERVTIAGGNPLENWSFTNKVINYFKEVFDTSIEVILPCIELDNQYLKVFVENHVTIKFSLFAEKMEDKEFVKRLAQQIGKYEQEGIDIKLNLIYNCKNKYNITYIHNTVAELDVVSVDLTHLFYTKDDRLVALDTDWRRVEDIGMNEYYGRTSCRNGKIALIANGVIRPCAFSSHKLGHLSDGLTSVFKEKEYKNFWKYTKKDAKVCSECENRYACIDCDLIHEEMELEEDLLQLICGYNPVEGRWNVAEHEREEFEWPL